MSAYSIGLFSSGRDQAALDLLKCILNCTSIEPPYIPAKIAYVFCDREPGESVESDLFLAFAESQGLTIVTESSRQLRLAIKDGRADVAEIRKAFDARVLQKVTKFSVDNVVFAGYMLVASDVLCGSLCCLNLHPALPGGPKGTWKQVIRGLLLSRDRETGVMLHIATSDLDRGPTVAYIRVPLGEHKDFDSIRQAQVKYERALLAITLKQLAERRFFISRLGIRAYPYELKGILDLTDKAEIFLSWYKKHFPS